MYPPLYLYLFISWSRDCRHCTRFSTFFTLPCCFACARNPLFSCYIYIRSLFIFGSASTSCLPASVSGVKRRVVAFFKCHMHELLLKWSTSSVVNWLANHNAEVYSNFSFSILTSKAFWWWCLIFFSFLKDSRKITNKIQDRDFRDISRKISIYYFMPGHVFSINYLLIKLLIWIKNGHSVVLF